MAIAQPFVALNYGNSERAYLGSNTGVSPPAAFLASITSNYGTSNLPQREVGRYGMFNIGPSTTMAAFFVRWGKSRGVIAHNTILRSNSGVGANNVFPYGNTST